MARIGRPHIQWSVNKLARAVTIWTKTCDKSLARFISYIHHTCDYRQHCLCGKHSATLQIRIVSRFWFCRRPWRLKVNFRWNFVHFRKPNICANILDVPETDISLTQLNRSWSYCSRAGLGMDGIPALDLWDLVIEVFHSSPNQTNKTKDVRESRRNLSAIPQSHKRKQMSTTNSNLDLTNIDHVPSSGTRSGSNVMLYVFEDNEAVIKMIIKGRSPSMRHVSRTHRVALDWLFDMINLDSQIQIRYIDSKHQLADILTKGNFTRDEWNNLLHLFNISHFSSTCCAKNSSLISCSKTLTKRMQEQKGEERSVTISKSTAMNLSSRVPTRSSSAKSLVASKSRGILIATGKPESRMRRNSKSDVASSSQAQLTDEYLGELMDKVTAKSVATKEESGDVDLAESENGSEEEAVLARLVAYKTATVKPMHLVTQTVREVQKLKGQNGNNLRVSPGTVHHTEAVFSIVRGSTDENMTTLWMIWTWMWLLGQISEFHSSSSSSSWTRPWREFTLREESSLEQCATVIQWKWKTDRWTKKITDVSTKDFQDATWMSTNLKGGKGLSDHQRQSVRLLWFSALCGKMGGGPIATWKSKIKWYSENNHFKDMNRIDGVPTEFEWKIFPGIMTLCLLEKFKV